MTTTTFEPMLAGSAPALLEALKYPLLASPKLDGVRALIQGGVLLSRTAKRIPNVHVRRQLEGLPDGLDGELLSDGGFNVTQSKVMTAEGRPDGVFFHVFDCFHSTLPFAKRLEIAERAVRKHDGPARLVLHREIRTPEELLLYETEALAQGHEGVMLRSINGPYKQGRSTTKQGWLLKLKRFNDAEAVIVGTVERDHNFNEAVLDAHGRTKRSSHKVNKVPAGDLGALVCVTPQGVQFQIGTGFSAEERKRLWKRRESLVGQTVSYKYQPEPVPIPGAAPRFPVFLRFRILE